MINWYLSRDQRKWKSKPEGYLRKSVPGRGDNFKGPDVGIWLLCSWSNRDQFGWNRVSKKEHSRNEHRARLGVWVKQIMQSLAFKSVVLGLLASHLIPGTK